MSPIMQKWKRRISDAIYAADPNRSRWEGAVNKSPKQTSPHPVGKRNGIAPKS